MNRFRRVAAALLAILFSLIFGLPTVSADAKGLDIVVLLDASGSMKNNKDIPANADVGKKYLVPGVETLINALAVQPYAVNMGVVIFSLPANTITIDDRLWNLTDGETPNAANAETLIEEVQTEYQYKSHTDQPNAVQTAIDLLDTGDAGNTKLILLITDGVNDDGTGNSAGIDAKQPDVIKTAKDKGIIISTIGFNPNDDDFSKLDDYAYETGGVPVQIKTPEKIGLTLIDAILDNVRTIEIPEDETYFELPIEVDELIGGIPVNGLNLIFDSNQVTDITLTTAKNVLIDERSSRLTINSSVNEVTVHVDVDGDYGNWLLTGNKPYGTKVALLYSLDNDIPEPAPETSRQTLPEPVTLTVTETTTVAPETTTETTTVAPETTTAVPETTTVTTTTVAAVTTWNSTPPPRGPQIPVGLIILIVVLIAGGVALAVYISKRPKLSGKIILTAEGDGFAYYDEEAELDNTKTKQSLFDLFYGVADSIISDSDADEEEVNKFFKKITFEATGTEHGLKFKTETKAETIYPDRGVKEFTATFTTSSSVSEQDEDDVYAENDTSTVTASFAIRYTVEKAEEEEEYGE
jgi:hypothetical protein